MFALHMSLADKVGSLGGGESAISETEIFKRFCKNFTYFWKIKWIFLDKKLFRNYMKPISEHFDEYFTI